MKHMNTTINKIIEIDKKAWAVKEKMQQIIQSSEQDSIRQIADLEKHMLEQARKEGRVLYEKYLAEGEAERKQILLEAENQCQELETTFSRIQEKLKEEIFHEIFKVE